MLDLWNFKKSVGAKTLYNMLFIFLFFYYFGIFFVKVYVCDCLGGKDRNLFEMRKLQSHKSDFES